MKITSNNRIAIFTLLLSIFLFAAQDASAAVSIASHVVRANCESFSIEASTGGFIDPQEVNGYVEWSLTPGGPYKRGSELYSMHTNFIPEWTGGSKLVGKILFANPSTTYYIRIKYREGHGVTSYTTYPASNDVAVTTWACDATEPSVISCVDGSEDSGTLCEDSKCTGKPCYTSIQLAIDAYNNSSGGTILVENGVFHESLQIHGKNGASLSSPLYLKSMTKAGIKGGARLDGSSALYTNPSWTLCTSAQNSFCDNTPNSKGVYVMTYANDALDGLIEVHSVVQTTGAVDRFYPMNLIKSSIGECIDKLENEPTMQPAFCVDSSANKIYVHIHPINGTGVNPSNYSWRFTPKTGSFYAITIDAQGVAAPVKFIVIDGFAVEYFNYQSLNASNTNYLIAKNIRTEGHGSMLVEGGASAFNVLRNNELHLQNGAKWKGDNCKYGSICVPSGGFSMGAGHNNVVMDNIIEPGYEDPIQNEHGHTLYTTSYDHDFVRNHISGTADDSIELDSSDYLIAVWDNSLTGLEGGTYPNQSSMCFSTSPLIHGPLYLLYNLCEGDFSYFTKSNRGRGPGWLIAAHNTTQFIADQKWGASNGAQIGANTWISSCSNNAARLCGANSECSPGICDFTNPSADDEFNNTVMYNNIFVTRGSIYVPETPPHASLYPSVSEAYYKLDNNAYYTTNPNAYSWYSSTCTSLTGSGNNLGAWQKMSLCGLQYCNAGDGDACTSHSDCMADCKSAGNPYTCCAGPGLGASCTCDATQDIHSVALQSQPQWVNQNDNDYRLTAANTNLIDKGKVLFGINTNTLNGSHDFRDAAPDIGAFEMQGIVPNMPPAPPQNVRVG